MESGFGSRYSGEYDDVEAHEQTCSYNTQQVLVCLSVGRSVKTVPFSIVFPLYFLDLIVKLHTIL